MSKFIDKKSTLFVINEKGQERQVAEGFEVFHSSDFNEMSEPDKFFLAKKGDKLTLLNEDFVPVLEFYEFMIFRFSVGESRFLTVRKNNKIGVVTYKDEVIAPCEYDEINSANTNDYTLFSVKKNGKTFYAKFPTSPNSKVIEYMD